MHHDKTLFTDYHKLKHRLYVGGIGSGLLAVGVGNVPIMDKAGHVRIFQNSRMASYRLRSSQSKGGRQLFTKAAVQYRTATLVFIVLLRMDYAGGFKRSPLKPMLLSHQPPSQKSLSMTGTNDLDILY